MYWVAQIAGGIVGALLLMVVLGGSDSGLGATTLASDVEPCQGLVLEASLTFLLVNSVLHSAVAGKAGNLAPVVVGLTLVVAILIGGPLTGASLNPARTLGPALLTDNLGSF